MKQVKLTVKCNLEIADRVWLMNLAGDVSNVTAPGQFINIALPGHFLRRPISVCDVQGDTVTILYKVVGGGTGLMTSLRPGTVLDVLTGLGNGFDLSRAGDRPLIVGGGIGSAPMLYLARRLNEMGVRPTVVLGFNTIGEVLLEEEFACFTDSERIRVATVDGSYGTRGFVTDAFEGLEYSYFYACGPMPMLKAVYRNTSAGGVGAAGVPGGGDSAAGSTAAEAVRGEIKCGVKTAAGKAAAHGIIVAKAPRDGEFSLEERMGCGFGACVGCSINTRHGIKRICKDGPVFRREELAWED